MNSTEIAGLCRYVAAMCPAQKMDEATPDAWSHVLRDVRVEDARDAVIELAKRQQFIAPSEIRAEVRRIRSKRLEAPDAEPPAEAAASPTAYISWLRRERRAVADGRPRPAPAQIAARPEQVRAILAGAFQAVPEDGAT